VVFCAWLPQKATPLFIKMEWNKENRFAIMQQWEKEWVAKHGTVAYYDPVSKKAVTFGDIQKRREKGIILAEKLYKEFRKK